MFTLKKYKPVTPSLRNRTTIKINTIQLIKTSLEKKKLLKRVIKNGGRNNQGVITVRHQETGHKKLYRIVDFKRQIAAGCVKNIIYDPNRNALVAKIENINDSTDIGLILAPKDLQIGSIVRSSPNLENLNIGDCTLLRNFPVGSLIHNIELTRFKGGQIVRTAGNFAQLIEKVNTKVCRIRLSSGEQRLINLDCCATLGVLDNAIFQRKVLGKAGVSRWLGIRPTVRGVAMNPVDHPHGGGEGKTSGGRPSVTPRGLPTKGQPTRKKKINKNILIFSRDFKNIKKKSTRKGKYSI